MPFIQPLDLQTLLINFLSGGVPIFIGLAFIAISMVAGMFRMPTPIYLVFLLIFSYLMYSSLISAGDGFVLFSIILIIISIVVFAIFRRGVIDR